MQRSGKRLLPAFITLVVIIVLVVGVVTVGRLLFSGGSAPDSTEVEDRGRQELLTTDASNSVLMSVRGPIVAEEEFNSYSIEIAPNSRNMTVYTGYLDNVEEAKNLSNNQDAYTQFVYALDKANMMKGEMPTDDAENDLRGICATGYVYEYKVLVNGQPVKRLWTSTCSGSKGSLDASVEQLNNLFFAQIPDQEELSPFNTNAFRLRF